METPRVPLTQEQRQSLQRIAQRDDWETQEIAQTILDYSIPKGSSSSDSAFDSATS